LTAEEVINKVTFSFDGKPVRSELFLQGEAIKPAKNRFYSIENKKIYKW